MADNYLENKFEELEARRAKEQRKRQAAYKKRMEVYRKKLEEERRKELNIIVRKACKEDAQTIAKCILMAIPIDGFESLGNGISKDELAAVLENIAQMDNAIYSYNNVMVAEVYDSKSIAPDEYAVSSIKRTSVGAIVTYDGACLHQLRKPLEDLLEQYIGPEAHQWDDETSAGEFYIDTLAVDPQYRGMNIGSMLIEAACRKASELGHKKAGLLVDLENPLAERLYTRLGFEFVNFTPFMQHTYKHLQRKL